ncbi:MAG: nucleotidyltransferase family protein [bacterium]
MRPSFERRGSPAAKLLLAAAHLDPRPADVRRAREALTSDPAIEWEQFVPLARRHGVLPLLHRHLCTGAFDARLVPSAALERIRGEAERIAQRGLMIAGELVVLLAELDRAGIRTLPLKGPLLAQQLYGSVSLRRMNDLDLLVARDDAERAVELLGELGFGQESTWSSETLGAIHRDVSNHVCLRSTTKPYRVELHYYLLVPEGRWRLPLSALDGELERTAFFGASVWTMRPEALAVYLCMHGTKHAWARIEWIGGLAELLCSGRVVDWPRVAVVARRLGAERALASGLCLAEELFEVRLPTAVVRTDAAGRSAALAVSTRLRLDPDPPRAAATLAHNLRVDANLRSRIRRLWSVLFVPTLSERTAVPLPRLLSPAYYALRPAGIVMRRLKRWVAGR